MQRSDDRTCTLIRPVLVLSDNRSAVTQLNGPSLIADRTTRLTIPRVEHLVDSRYVPHPPPQKLNDASHSFFQKRHNPKARTIRLALASYESQLKQCHENTRNTLISFPERGGSPSRPRRNTSAAVKSLVSLRTRNRYRRRVLALSGNTRTQSSNYRRLLLPEAPEVPPPNQLDKSHHLFSPETFLRFRFCTRGSCWSGNPRTLTNVGTPGGDVVLLCE